MSDDLIERWRRGDFEAFLRLAQSAVADLRLYAAAHGPRGADAPDGDDLAQDALVEAFESAASYVPARGDVRGWLFGVLRTRIRRAWQDHARGRERLSRLQTGAVQRAMEEPPADAGGPLEALRRCVETLPEKAVGLLDATYRDGTPAAGLADRYGGSESAVHVALHRLRRALRDCIERRLKEEPA